MPSEEELFSIYAKLSESMPASSIVIRTMDLGSDKVLPYLYHEKEDNPAMGCRGIRFCFKHKELFKVQLKAIYRANFLGNFDDEIRFGGRRRWCPCDLRGGHFGCASRLAFAARRCDRRVCRRRFWLQL